MKDSNFSTTCISTNASQILQSVTASNVVDVVRRLRRNLELESLVGRQHGEQEDDESSSQWIRSSTKVGECVTLDAIKSGIRYQKITGDAWLKAIQAPKEASEQKPVDLFVLLMIHDMANQKKAVTTLIHRRVKAACITAGLIETVFGVHGRALRDYTKPLLSISESLMRSATNGAREVASELYGQVFKHFESYEQQEVVGALVTHVGSGNPEEVDAAISLLDRLVCAHPEEMDQFYIFLKGMLDYIDNLGVHHIRILFHMLSFLITHGESPDSKSDDLHIFVRKMLTKNTLHDKRIGVIGATMMIQAIAEKSQREGGGKDDGGSVATAVKRAAAAAVSSAGAANNMDDGDGEGTCIGQSMNLLRLIRDQVLGDGETEAALSGSDAGNVFAAGLVYDELASTVSSGNLNEELISWIQEEITGRFQELYLADLGEALPDELHHHEIVPKALFSLDDDEDGEIVVNFLPAMLEPQRGSILSMVCMCPLFRLLQKCESQASGGDLEEIDALLGCAVYAVPKTSIAEFKDLSSETKDSVCSSLFFLINWFREVVNTFAGQEDPEMQIKVLQRLEHIADSEEDLRKCLKLHPTFQPFPALFETDVKLSVAKRKRSKGPGGSGGAGSKQASGNLDDDEGDELDGGGGGGGKKVKKEKGKGRVTKKGGAAVETEKAGADADSAVGGDADADADADGDGDEEEGDGKASTKKGSNTKRKAGSAAKPKRKRKTKTKTKATEEGEGGSVARTGDDDDDDGDGDDGDDVDYDVDDDESGGGSKTKKKTAGKSPQEPAALAFLPVLDMEAHLSHFRELELDVFQVLGREVVMDKLDTMNKTEVDQQSTFELPTEATLLLLRDLRRKLQRGLHPPKSTPWGTTKHSQTAGFALLLAKDAAEVASWSLEMIPRLCKLLETTVSNFSGIIDEHDGMNDVSMFVDEEKAPVWAETFDLLLRVFQLIISWRGFGRSTAKEAMLNSGLAAIASRLGDDDDDDDDDGEETEAAADGAATSLATRCNKAFQYFHAQGDFIPTAEVFETYLQLLGTLWDIADAEGTHSDGIATKIAGACDGALKRGWSVDEKKPIKPNLLQSILTAFLKYSKSPLMSVSAIVKTGMQELVESAKTSASDDGVKGGSKEKSTALSSKTFATLTKSTFPCYHRTVLAKLVEIVSNGHMHESLNLLTETHFERDMEIMVTDNLGKMEHCFANFKFLLECVRHESLQNRSILIPTFRLGAKFVDAFQKKCMPLLEAQFRQHSSEIVALLKTVQQATRSLQRLCSHFKDEKRDEKLTSFVPALKRSLETLVFRTKAMLVNNNCRDAIIIGNLKNKDFSKGQIVSSQVPLTANTEDEDEDEDEDMGSDVGSDLNAEDGEA